MKPLVSILIPAYNAQEWIAMTLRSAIAQTWPRTEIIVVDDGSTDHTLGIARGFEDRGVRVVAQENRGAAAARNKALSLSQGDYIQWLDADDLLAPDKIALQIRALDRGLSKLTLLSSAWGHFLYRYSRARFVPTALWRDLSQTEWLVRKLGRNINMPVHSWLVSRELTEAAGPWDTSLAVDDDGEYFCRVLLASEGVRFVPEAKVYYRMSGSKSVSHIGTSDRKLEAQLRSMKLHIAYLRTLEDSQQVREACVAYLQNWLLCFYPRRLDLVEQMEEHASKIGGRLVIPRLSWKYQWIKATFGWDLAIRTQISLRSLKWSLDRCCDKTLFCLENVYLRESTRLEKIRNHVPVRESGVVGKKLTSRSVAIEKMEGESRLGISQLVTRAQGRYQRATARYLCQRPFTIDSRIPIISFTFDDFPRSALLAGGAILQSYGLAGTYYTSLGLMGQQTPTGNMFLTEDLEALVAQGHELGCHTFSHRHAWETSPRLFEDAIIENREALGRLIPGATFETLSYPIGVPRARTKQRVSKHFACCRGGGQTFNGGEVDLNFLSAYFLEQSRDNPEAIKRLIDQNRQARGWLIFATHDICKDPTRWGCTPDLLEDIVQYSVKSGARILPVYQAYKVLSDRHSKELDETRLIRDRARLDLEREPVSQTSNGTHHSN